MFDMTCLTIFFWQSLEVEVAVVVAVVAEVEVVEDLEVVLGRRLWEGCSVEECLNYDQSEVSSPFTPSTSMIGCYYLQLFFNVSPQTAL